MTYLEYLTIIWILIEDGAQLAHERRPNKTKILLHERSCIKCKKIKYLFRASYINYITVSIVGLILYSETKLNEVWKQQLVDGGALLG